MDEKARLLDRSLEWLETDNGQRIAIAAFSILSTLVLAAFPGTAAAYIFGVPYLFFIPGFAVVRLFFWHGSSPEAKFALSVGLSVIVMIFLGLILVATPVGLNEDSTRASMVIFSLGAVALESYWRPASTRKSLELEKGKKVPSAAKPDKVVAAMLATAVVVSVISLGLIVTADHPSRTFFAVTDVDDMIIADLRIELGANLTLILHTKNGEDGPRTFTMVAYGSNGTEPHVQNFTRVLAKGETWNQTVSFNMTQVGFSRLDFDLYIQEDQKPPIMYGNLHIWIQIVDT